MIVVVEGGKGGCGKSLGRGGGGRKGLMVVKDENDEIEKG